MGDWLTNLTRLQPNPANPDSIINREQIELANTDQGKAARDALSEHFLDPKTYRDGIHDFNTWSTNVVAKTPGFLPNMVGGLYGWAFNDPDNWMSNSGKWVDKYIGKPLASANPIGQAIDALTSEPGTRKPGWQLHDGKYSTALQNADTVGVMPFLEDLAAGSIATAGADKIAKIPGVRSFVKPTTDVVNKGWQGWKTAGNYAQSWMPKLFNRLAATSSIDPAKARMIEKGLGIFNKAAFKGLSWGAPLIDAYHNYATAHDRFEKFRPAAPLATLGYGLKLLSPYQMVINGTGSIPVVDEFLNNTGRKLYNNYVDEHVADTVERMGQSAGNQFVDDIDEVKRTGKLGDLEFPTDPREIPAFLEKIPKETQKRFKNYFANAAKASGPISRGGLNALINLHEGQYNSSNVKKLLPDYLRKTPAVRLITGAKDAAVDNMGTYFTKFNQGFTVPVVERLPGTVSEAIIDPQTGEFSLKPLYEKYKNTAPGRWDEPVSDMINDNIDDVASKLPEGVGTKVRNVKTKPWHIAATRPVIAELIQRAIDSKKEQEDE